MDAAPGRGFGAVERQQIPEPAARQWDEKEL
jgi:hypothetical protein